MLSATNTVDLIERAASSHLLDASQASALLSSHKLLLGRSLATKLDARPRVAARTDDLEQATSAVLRIARELDLAFD